jgi:SAM-dependent methyltransferase
MAKYDYFSQRRISFLGQFISNLFHKKVLHLFLKLGLDKESSFLEIGSGTGEFAQAILQFTENYSSYEVSKKLANQMNSKGFNTYCMAVPPLIKTPDQSIDFLLMSHVQEHMQTQADSIALVSECNRVLKPSGTIITIFPDLIDFGFDFWDVDYTHSFPLTFNRIHQLCSDNNLIIKNAIPIYGGVTGIVGLLANLAFKGFFFMINLLLPTLTYKMPKLIKLKTMFARSLIIVIQKSSNR